MKPLSTHRRLRKTQLFGWILVLCADVASAENLPSLRPAPHGGIAGEYLVVLADGVARDPLVPGSSGPAVSEVARRLATRYGGEVETSYEHALLGFSLRIGEAGARRLAADPAVRLVEQNATVEVSAIDNCDPTFQNVAIESRNPVNRAPTSPETIDCRDPDPIRRNGDPAPLPGENPNYRLSCIDNWGLDLIDGSRNERYDFSATGQGVHVYLIDLGLNQGHREFGARVKRGFNAALPDNALNIDPGVTTDCVANSHGTHVAAIVGGNTFGVAKGVWLHPVQFEDKCAGHSYAGSRNSVIRGVDWIVRTHNHHPDQMGPAVVNFSGGNGGDDSFRDGVMAVWVRRLLAAGISFVQSSGNQDNRDRIVGSTTIPQSSCANTLAKNSPLRDALIVAGGIDEDGAWGAKSYHRWQRETGDPSYPICSPNPIQDCGSNFGSCVDLWAPAAHIVSATNSDTASACRLSGTSMAAPHVTGVVALLLQRFPNASPSTVKKALVANATLNVVQAGSIGDSPNFLLKSTFPSSGGPVAGDSWLTTPPGVPLSILKNAILRGSLDWSGDALQFSRIGTNETAHGVLTESSDRLTYTPNGGFSGMDGFTYTVSDGHGGSDTATVRIEVQAPPQPLMPRDDCYAVPVRSFADCLSAPSSSVVVLGTQAGSFDLLTQGEGDVASFAIIDPPDLGQIGSNELGVPRYCPPATSGIDTFRYRIRDSYHQAAEATVTIHVGTGSCPATNRPPTPQDDFFSTNYNTSRSFFASTLLANDTDPDGDPVSFAGLAGEPVHGFLSVDGVAPEDIIYRYHPNPGFVGSDSFGYQVADPSGATATATVHFTVTNTGFGGNPDFFVTTANGLLPIVSSQLLANDSPGAQFLFAQNARHGSLKIGGVAPEGVLYHFYPDPNFVGEAGFEYLISPNGLEPYTRVDVTIQVNDGPPAAGFVASCNGASCSFDASSSTDDVGIDSYAWTFGDGTTGSGRTVSHNYVTGTYLATLTVTDTASHTASSEQVVIADPRPVACLTFSCTLRSCTFNASCSTDNQPLVAYDWTFGDGTTGSGVSVAHVYATGGPKTVVLTVTDTAGQKGIRSQSLALNRPPVAVSDAYFVTINVPRDLAVLANDSDADFDPLSVTTWTAPLHGSVLKNPNGTLRYSPSSGYLGGDSFTYQISDGKETAGPATVTLTVTPPNDAPDARDDGWSTYINGPTNIPFSHLLANDYDPNGDVLTVTLVTTAGLIGALDCSSGSYRRYTPPSTFAGVTSFTYTANDGKGGTDPATVRIKVGGVNNAPAPQDDLLETTRNTALVLLRSTLLGNDTDPDGDVLSVTSVYRAPLTAFGTISCSAAYYTCTYTPPAGFTGVDTLYYRASDGITFTDARIRILVRPPVPAVFDAREDRLFTTTNPTYISYASLLANDYDPEGGALTVVGVDTTGLLGTLDCTTFTTGCDYYRGTNDPTRFKITVRDPQGNLDTSTVTVKPGNQSFNKVPVLGNDTLSAHRNTPLPFSIFDLLRNDVDPDNDQLDVLIYPFTTNGRVNCTTPAYFCTYIPNANFTGTDTFSYTAHDGTHAVTGTVTVSVVP